MLIKSLFLKNNTHLFLLIFFIIVIRFLTLYFSPLELQGDEAQYWHWSTYFDLGYFSKPPLVAWIINLFIILFGKSVFVIKLPSLLAHFTTSIILYYLSLSFKRSEKESLWVSISYLLFFAVSLSSNIISTDPFLLLFWTLSLYFFKLSLVNKSSKYILLTSIFISLGFYAKYAMVYFFICSAIFIFISNNKKFLIKKILIIFIIVLILVSPHIYWVYSANWITLIHTGNNFNWGSNLFNFEQLFNFLFSQFFIATPIIFFIYLLSLKKFLTTIKSYTFEISYSLPVILLVSIQSFISRANANWSSVAFIGIIMISFNIIYKNYKKAFYANTVISFLVFLIISFFIINPPNISPFNKLKGLEKAATEVKFLDDSLISDFIVFDDRMHTAKFLYYLPSKNNKIRYLNQSSEPENHFAIHMPISIKELKNKKIIMIHRYKHTVNSLDNNVLVQQFYKMPNKKNNFFISYLE